MTGMDDTQTDEVIDDLAASDPSKAAAIADLLVGILAEDLDGPQDDVAEGGR